jgi:predicted ester cyclase
LFRKFVSAFPDIHFSVLNTVSEENKIAALAVARFTHSGTSFEAFPGKTIEPTGKSIEIYGITIAVIDKDQIIEAWNSFDFLGLYAQLGAL